MKHLLILLFTVSLLWNCCKEEPIVSCDDERSEFIYDGADDQDSLIYYPIGDFVWSDAWKPEDLVTFDVTRESSEPSSTYILTEILTIKIPPYEGKITPIVESRVRYIHLQDSDALGTDYIIDTLQENKLEVVCIDTIEQRICVSFDLHFIQDEESRYPWPEKVSFIQGLFCGSYLE